MRWRNRIVPTFAGAAGSAPADVEVMELLDDDGNVLKSHNKSVAGVYSESSAGASGNGLSTVSVADQRDFIEIVDVTPAVAASGYYTIATLPVNNETILFNGTTFTWKTSAVADEEVTIGAAAGGDTAIGVSIDNLLTKLNASVIAGVAVATYSDNHTASNKDGTRVVVTYDTAGAYGNSYTLGTQSAKSVRTGDVLSGGADESYASAKILANDGVVISKMVTFTENATNTVHTGTVAIPAGAWLHDIQVTSSVLWTGGTATMKVGDTADDDGYFIGVNLKATDLAVGEVLSAFEGSIDTDGLWGGKNGAYLVAASGRRGPTSNNFGMYYAAGSNIIGTVTVGTPATTAGRTFMKVIYSIGAVQAAVSTGP